MSKSNNLTDFLTDIANAIRQMKAMWGEKINPQDFSNLILSIRPDNALAVWKPANPAELFISLYDPREESQLALDVDILYDSDGNKYSGGLSADNGITITTSSFIDIVRLYTVEGDTYSSDLEISFDDDNCILTASSLPRFPDIFVVSLGRYRYVFEKGHN